jgi:nucleoside-diphosphate-sugar epimerase
MRGVTARLFSVYGPGDASGRLLPAIVEAAHAGTSVRLTPGDQRRDFTYVEDVAEGLLRLGAARPLGGDPVNLSTGSLVSVRVFAEIAAAVLGMSATALDFGVLPVRPDEVAYRSVDVSRLRALTGWTPATSVREGIRRTVELELERRSDWAGRPR